MVKMTTQKNRIRVTTQPKSLSVMLVESISSKIRDHSYSLGQKLPTESELITQYGVSRTVVREALSKLQAQGLVETRHGIGTFVKGLGETPFTVTPDQVGTLHEILALLELRMGVEVEAAGLAAERRSTADLKRMSLALKEFAKAISDGTDAIAADYKFHQAIAAATHNTHFLGLMNTLGSNLIPRARARNADYNRPEVKDYLSRVNLEHQDIFQCIKERDASAARAAMRIHLSNGLERRQTASSKDKR